MNASVTVTPDTIPCNPNATKEAKDLLQYLADCMGKCILTGQHTQTNPMEERAYLYEVTGHTPRWLDSKCLHIPEISIWKMRLKNAGSKWRKTGIRWRLP